MTDHDIQEMVDTGAPQEVIDRALDAMAEYGDDDSWEVLPENYDAVQLYVACYGKFEWLALDEKPTMLGFSSAAVELEIRMSGIEVTAETWAAFKYLERLTVERYRD